MEKFELLFNNSVYEIKESALNAASAALKSHLSTAMSGTGAIINLGGAAYGIDSTKLSAATNSFTSYLGKISGTGAKIVVNGQEYNIDSTKLASAITALETALGTLQSGGNEIVEQEVIFPEQTVSGFIAGEAVAFDTAPLVIGETYTVLWDGVSYTCVAYRASYSSPKVVWLGNKEYMEWDDGNQVGDAPDIVEPFVIYYAPSALTGESAVMVFSCTGHIDDSCVSDTHTIAIYKSKTIKPEVVFPLQTLTGFDGGDLGYSLMLPSDAFTLIPGEKYSVLWRGNVYADLIAYEGVVDDMPCVYIGDGSALGYPGNNELFAIISFESFALIASYAPIETTQTVAIYKGSMEYITMFDEILTFEADESGWTPIKSDSLLPLYAGKKYKVTWGDVEYTLTATAYNSENDGAIVILLGNPALAEYGQDNGYPFVIADIPLFNACACVTNEEITSKRVAISVNRGEWTHSLSDVLVFEYNSNYGLHIAELMPSPMTVEIGKTYKVNWDGITYICTAQDMSAFEPGAIGLGNLTQFGGSSNGEPFIIGYLKVNEVFAGMLIASFDSEKAEHYVGLAYKNDSDNSSSKVTILEPGIYTFNERNENDDTASNDDISSTGALFDTSNALTVGETYTVI